MLASSKRHFRTSGNRVSQSAAMFVIRRCVVFSVLVLAVCISRYAAADVKLPQGFKICSLSDPKYSECLREAAELDMNILANGYPELDIPPINPFHLPPMKFSVGGQNNENIAFTVQLDNTEVSYIVDKVTEMTVDRENMKTHMVLKLKELTMTGKHTANGKFFFGQLNGHGPCKVTLYDSTMTYDSEYNLVKNNDEDYMHFTKINVKMNPTRVHGYFDNILGTNNKQVNDGVNNLINENWKLVYGPVFPLVEKETSGVLRDAMNRLSDKVPFKQLFPE